MVAKICFKFHLLIAFSLRLVFTLYGFYHDYEASKRGTTPHLSLSKAFIE